MAPTPNAAWTTPSSLGGCPLDRRVTVGATARQRWSPATATMSMPAIDIGALFIGREDREGNDGSGVAMEDDDDANAEAGEYVHDFLEVVFRRLWEGFFWEEEDDDEYDGDERRQRARRRCRDAVDVRDALQGQAIVIVVDGSPEAPTRVGGADPSRKNGSRMG